MLAELKRNLKVGDRVEIIEVYNPMNQRPYTIPERLRGVRLVTRANSVGWYFGTSFCDYPKAKDLEYSGDTFKIIDRSAVDAYRVYKIIKQEKCDCTSCGRGGVL